MTAGFVSSAFGYCANKARSYPYITLSAGTISGIVSGAISNIANSFSFFSHSIQDCRDFSSTTMFGPISNWREKQFKGYLVPFFPLPLIALTSLFAIGNAFKKEVNVPRTAMSVAKKMTGNLYKMTVSPLLRNISANLIAFTLRGLFQDEFGKRFGIDVSGHAVLHFVYLAYIYNSLVSLSEVVSSNQAVLALIPLALLSFTEVAWMYNTTANCHSVADVVTGLAFGSLATLAVDKVAVPSVIWGCRRIWNCLSRQ